MPSSEILCRLCAEASSPQFTVRLLQKHDVTFFRCSGCESLQSEAPYWLDEAYGGQRAIPDIAATARLQQMVTLAFFIAKLFGIHGDDPVLDLGGGDGFLVRRLRDLGLNAYLLDKFATNRYAVGFEGDENGKYRCLTAFEVWEHFAEPGPEIERMFNMEPEVLLISTGLYSGQDASWPYLTPLSGRHIFFYSMQARRFIAQRFGYHLIAKGSFAIFHRSGLSSVRESLARAALTQKGQRLQSLLTPFIPTSPRMQTDRHLATDIIEAGGAGRINWP